MVCWRAINQERNTNENQHVSADIHCDILVLRCTSGLWGFCSRGFGFVWWPTKAGSSTLWVLAYLICTCFLWIVDRRCCFVALIEFRIDFLGLFSVCLFVNDHTLIAIGGNCLFDLYLIKSKFNHEIYWVYSIRFSFQNWEFKHKFSHMKLIYWHFRGIGFIIWIWSS